MSAVISYIVSLFMVVALVLFFASGAFFLLYLARLIPDFLLLPRWRRSNREYYSNVSEQVAREKMIAKHDELDLWMLKHDLMTVFMYLCTMLTSVVIIYLQQAVSDNRIVAGLKNAIEASLRHPIVAIATILIFIYLWYDRSEEKSGYVFETRMEIENLRLPITSAKVVHLADEDRRSVYNDVLAKLRKPRLGS